GRWRIAAPGQKVHLMSSGYRGAFLRVLRPATAIRYCGKHQWLIINAAFIGLSAATSLTVYFSSDDNQFWQALITFLTACLLPTLTSLATTWHFSVLQRRFGHLSEH